MKIVGISGSLRRESLNSRLLAAVGERLGDRATFEVLSLDPLPLFNEDLGLPEGVASFNARLQAADALIVATPEYNHSVPGVLKNALDWASRPSYRSPLRDLPTGLVSASPGMVGGARAQAHLKQILLGTATPVFPYPDFLVSQAPGRFDAEGRLTDGPTLQFLDRYLDNFLAWAERSRRG